MRLVKLLKTLAEVTFCGSARKFAEVKAKLLKTLTEVLRKLRRRPPLYKYNPPLPPLGRRNAVFGD